ncbi:Uncharacterised protein [Escherichia coli]|nr:Uncharacterised protein [Escherichia coli]
MLTLLPNVAAPVTSSVVLNVPDVADIAPESSEPTVAFPVTPSVPPIVALLVTANAVPSPLRAIDGAVAAPVTPSVPPIVALPFECRVVATERLLASTSVLDKSNAPGVNVPVILTLLPNVAAPVTPSVVLNVPEVADIAPESSEPTVAFPVTSKVPPTVPFVVTANVPVLSSCEVTLPDAVTVEVETPPVRVLAPVTLNVVAAVTLFTLRSAPDRSKPPSGINAPLTVSFCTVLSPVTSRVDAVRPPFILAAPVTPRVVVTVALLRVESPEILALGAVIVPAST